jgi:hypothetical protein
MGCQWFGLKTTGTVYQWFGLKTTEMVCQWFGLKTTRKISPTLASKPVVMVFLVWPQNQERRFPDLGLKTDSCGLVICASKLPRRFLGLSLKTM